MDGDLQGGRSGQDAGRQRAAGDFDDLALAARAGPGIEQLAGAIAERPGRVSRQGRVLSGRDQANASGSIPSPNAATDSLACRSSIRRSHSPHGVGRHKGPA